MAATAILSLVSRIEDPVRLFFHTFSPACMSYLGLSICLIVFQEKIRSVFFLGTFFYRILKESNKKGGK